MSLPSRTALVPERILFFATLPVLALIGVPQEAKAVGPQGSLEMRMAFGQAGKVLNRQGVRVLVNGKGANRTGSGAKVKIELPVNDVSFNGQSSVALGGSLIFKRKVKSKVRQVRLNSPVFRGSEGSRVIRAKHSGKDVSVFRAPGAYSLNRLVGTVILPRTDLILTGTGAKLIRKALGLKKLPASKVGLISLDSQAAFEDPFAAECELPATSKTAGSLPVAGPLPEFDSPTPLLGDNLTWGFKESFRGYIFGVGLFRAEGGATVNPNRFPGPPASFTFPFQSGEFSNQGSTPRVTQLASGSIMGCHKGQFRLTMSDPAVVIDGDRSRIVMTIDTNVSGNWIPGQRVDFATLNITGIVPSESGGVTTWTSVPATLTQTGADALRLCSPDAPSPCPYAAGSALDPITVRALTSGG